MRLGKTIPILLAGWYLIMPPHVPSENQPTPPLCQWSTFEAFDTAAACERERARDIRARNKELNAPPGGRLNSGFSVYGPVRPFEYSECIATDDPRLSCGGP